ncbi:MAG TPA: terminase small subunit [Rhodocyclaceae bacterium]|nr:terminase small subunit [Rhodocyclaceae bacterium]
MSFTPKQSAFIAEYLVDKNATQAAIRAGYSMKTAASIGEENLRKPEIRAAIDAGLAKLAEKAGLSAELVLSSLTRELSFDPADLYDEWGNIKPIHEIPADARKCLVGMETAQVGSPDAPVMVQKVKWVNPAQAREQAMKHLGMFEKDNAQKPPQTVTEIRLVALVAGPDSVERGA